MKKPSEQYKINQAKKRVAEIKGFYGHLIIYLVINGFLILSSGLVFSGSWNVMFMPDWAYFTTPFFWGIALFFHGLSAYKLNIAPIRKWEERKIKEFMEQEENESSIL